MEDVQMRGNPVSFITFIPYFLMFLRNDKATIANIRSNVKNNIFNNTYKIPSQIKASGSFIKPYQYIIDEFGKTPLKPLGLEFWRST
jgi:hypothetical protein